MSELLGIDVSKWQKTINWNEVKNSGINFVMIRATYGIDSIDEYFKTNIDNATISGLNIGAYHYCYAKSVQEALQEAKHFLNTIKPYKLTYPVVLDLEDNSIADLGTNTITQIALTFLQYLESNGYYAMLYSNKNWLENKLDMNKLKNFDVWLAQYNNTITYNGTIGMWQYSNTGSVDGINGNVDMNKSYKNYADIITAKGLNNISSNVQNKTKIRFNLLGEKTVDINGKIENGISVVETRALLEELGYTVDWDSKEKTILVKK